MAKVKSPKKTAKAKKSQPKAVKATKQTKTTPKPKTAVRKIAKPKAKVKPAKKPVGRPTKCTPEVTEIICDRLADGMSLRKMCEIDKTLPARSTVLRWQRKAELGEEQYANFKTMYACAKDQQVEGEMDEIVDIADAATPKTAHVAGLRITTRIKKAEKLKPKKYGNVQRIEGTMAHTWEDDQLEGAIVDKIAGELVKKVIANVPSPGAVSVKALPAPGEAKSEAAKRRGKVM